MSCPILKYAGSKFFNFNKQDFESHRKILQFDIDVSFGKPVCVEFPTQSVYLHLFLMRTLWLDTDRVCACACEGVFSCIHMLALVCVFACLQSLCVVVWNTQWGTELKRVCVCVCVSLREYVYVLQRCVTLANESLRSPAVQGWLD